MFIQHTLDLGRIVFFFLVISNVSGKSSPQKSTLQPGRSSGGDNQDWLSDPNRYHSPPIVGIPWLHLQQLMIVIDSHYLHD